MYEKLTTLINCKLQDILYIFKNKEIIEAEIVGLHLIDSYSADSDINVISGADEDFSYLSHDDLSIMDVYITDNPTELKNIILDSKIKKLEKELKELKDQQEPKKK